MSEFVSKCPYCGTELILDEEWIGRNAQCFSCDNKFHIAKPNDDAKENIISGTDELNKSTENKDLVKKAAPPQTFKKAEPPPTFAKIETPPPKTPNSTNTRMDSPNYPNVGAAQQSYEKDSYDSEEDEFVLRYLKSAKTVLFIMAILESIGLLIYTIKLGSEVLGILLLLIGAFVIAGNYFLLKAVFSWMRGVYRNLIR